MAVGNMLDPRSTISDYGKFADPNIPVNQENVFVKNDYGVIEVSLLKKIIKEVMQEELSKMLTDMGSFQVKNGQLYYGDKRLVYASEIFIS